MVQGRRDFAFGIEQATDRVNVRLRRPQAAVTSATWGKPPVHEPAGRARGASSPRLGSLVRPLPQGDPQRHRVRPADRGRAGAVDGTATVSSTGSFPSAADPQKIAPCQGGRTIRRGRARSCAPRRRRCRRTSSSSGRRSYASRASSTTGWPASRRRAHRPAAARAHARRQRGRDPDPDRVGSRGRLTIRLRQRRDARSRRGARLQVTLARARRRRRARTTTLYVAGVPYYAAGHDRPGRPPRCRRCASRSRTEGRRQGPCASCARMGDEGSPCHELEP